MSYKDRLMHFKLPSPKYDFTADLTGIVERPVREISRLYFYRRPM